MAIEEHNFVDANGNHTFFLAAGPQDGTLVVFCHGWPAIAATWKSQLETFASLGYRVVAPDMPGYGKSHVSHDLADYSLESIHASMLALLKHCERKAAVWIGHDWGAVAVWSFAAHFPEQTIAVAGLARPCHTLELGLEEVIPTINRDIFPFEEYPYGQYDYQVYFEEAFEEASKWFDQDIEGVLRAIYMTGKPDEVGKPGATASVTKNRGWFGGAPAPPPQLRHIPIEALCVDKDTFHSVVAAMQRHGFRSANAWYTNHKQNRTYFLEKAKNEGYLLMPALFVGALWDPISDITISTIAQAQRTYCKDLTEVNVEAGHWVALEKPAAVNEAIAKWLEKSVSKISSASA